MRPERHQPAKVKQAPCHNSQMADLRNMFQSVPVSFSQTGTQLERLISAAFSPLFQLFQSISYKDIGGCKYIIIGKRTGTLEHWNGPREVFP